MNLIDNAAYAALFMATINEYNGYVMRFTVINGKVVKL